MEAKLTHTCIPALSPPSTLLSPPEDMGLLTPASHLLRCRAWAKNPTRAGRSSGSVWQGAAGAAGLRRGNCDSPTNDCPVQMESTPKSTVKGRTLKGWLLLGRKASAGMRNRKKGAEQPRSLSTDWAYLRRTAYPTARCTGQGTQGCHGVLLELGGENIHH